MADPFWYGENQADQTRLRQGFAQQLANTNGNIAAARANDNVGRMEQAGANRMLYNQAAGIGPSVAQGQLNAGMQQGFAQALAMARSGRGANPYAAMRGAQTANGQLAAQTNQQAALLRLQEQQQAQQAYAQQLGMVRGQDQSLMQLGQQREGQYLQSQDAMNQAAINARVQQGQLAAQKRQQNFQLAGSILGGIGGGAATLFSDERLKEDIKEDPAAARDFLEAVRGYHYKYKDQSLGSGPQYGVMAQDLERSSVGKTLVSETPIGKVVDTRRGFTAVLAAAADLHQRVKKLESR